MLQFPDGSIAGLRGWRKRGGAVKSLGCTEFGLRAALVLLGLVSILSLAALPMRLRTHDAAHE